MLFYSKLSSGQVPRACTATWRKQKRYKVRTSAMMRSREHAKRMRSMKPTAVNQCQPSFGTSYTKECSSCGAQVIKHTGSISICTPNNKACVSCRHQLDDDNMCQLLDVWSQRNWTTCNDSPHSRSLIMRNRQDTPRAEWQDSAAWSHHQEAVHPVEVLTYTPNLSS